MALWVTIGGDLTQGIDMQEAPSRYTLSDSDLFWKHVLSDFFIHLFLTTLVFQPTYRALVRVRRQFRVIL